MRCHYEVLGIEEDADVAQIKKSYRKLALKYHPDKNQGREEEAAAFFREAQSAYATLSDPQERAWYDKHKEALLMKSGTYEDKEVVLAPYCSLSRFQGFGADEKGFYAVYQKLFKELSEEDYTFMNADDEDYPQFGDADTDVEWIVSVFYGFWSSFATKKSYVWEEEWDTREAPNRWVKRKMEQENNKKTEQARKERSKEVQAVVDWIRRKDPRVQKYREKLAERQKEIEAKAAVKKKEKLHQDMLKAAQYEQDNKERIQAEADELARLERELYGSESETESYNSDEENQEVPNEEDLILNMTEEQINKVREEMLRDEELLAQKLKEAAVFKESEEEEEIFAPKLSKKARKKQKQREKEMRTMQQDAESEEQKSDDDKLKEETVSSETNTIISEENTPPVKKLSAKEKRRQREKQRQEEAAKKKEAEKANQIPMCNLCKEEFTSRTQLFKHIKETGHAELKTVAPTKSKKGKRK